MIHDVVEVKVEKDYILFLRFANDKRGYIDLGPILKFEQPIFRPLKDKKYFSTVTINPDIGTICWENGADISPDFLYKNITQKIPASRRI